MDWVQLYEPVWPTYLSTTCLGRKSSDSTYFLLWNTRIQPWTSRVWGGITWVYSSLHQNNPASESFLKSVVYHLWFKRSMKRKTHKVQKCRNVRHERVFFFLLFMFTQPDRRNWNLHVQNQKPASGSNVFSAQYLHAADLCCVPWRESKREQHPGAVKQILYANLTMWLIRAHSNRKWARENPAYVTWGKKTRLIVIRVCESKWNLWKRGNWLWLKAPFELYFRYFLAK